MGFFQAIKTCLQKYVDFSGRASRPEFWYFSAVFLAILVLNTWNISRINGPINSELRIALLTLFPLSIPMFSVAKRRIHDVGKSGLSLAYPIIGLGIGVAIYTFVGLAGIVMYGSNPAEGVVPNGLFEAAGFFALAAFLVPLLFVARELSRPSDPNTNKYGPNPLEVTQ